MNAHGSLEHFVAICIATKICYDRGYKILDAQWFKDKQLYKGEPDLYIEREDKSYKDGKRYTIKEKFVIEIECNPTNESVAKKLQQFQTSVYDCELIICDMRNCDMNSISSISKYLTERIP